MVLLQWKRWCIHRDPPLTGGIFFFQEFHASRQGARRVGPLGGHPTPMRLDLGLLIAVGRYPRDPIGFRKLSCPLARLIANSAFGGHP